MRWMIFPLSVMLTLGLAGHAAADIDWFSDYNDEGIGLWDDDDDGDGDDAGVTGGDDNAFTGYESDDFGFDEGIHDDDSFENDDYGAYDSDYDWDTDDTWFDGWYGESDDAF